MQRWRQAVEAAMTDEEIGSLTVLSRSRTEPASRVERAQMLLAYREKPVVLCGGAKARRASSDGPALRRAGRWRMGRWRHSMTARDPVRSRRSRRRPKPGWCPLACDKAKEHGYPHEFMDDAAAGTSCARVRTGGGARMSRHPGPGHGVANFSAKRKSNRTRCATTWNAAMLSSSRRWRRFCVSIARSKS